jgi:hypothetical protein
MKTQREVSPKTVDKAQRLSELLLEAQILANELVVNNEFGDLKIGSTNIDMLIMEIKYNVIQYKKDIQSAMAHSF